MTQELQTQVAPPEKLQGVALLKHQLDRHSSEFAKALPGNISVERFVRTAQTAIAFTRNIEKANPASLMAACSKAAADGLILDGREAALVIDYKGEVQYRIMVGGKKKLLWNTGMVAGLTLAAVHENDVFQYVLGDDESITHTVDLRTDRGKVFAYYAIVRLKDGAVVRAVMTIGQVNAIRDRSDAWKAFAAKKISSTPWSTDPEEMGLKTVFHRISKSLPKSEATAAFDRAIERDEEDFTLDGTATEVTPTTAIPAPATKKRGGAAAALRDVTPAVNPAKPAQAQPEPAHDADGVIIDQTGDPGFEPDASQQPMDDI